MKEMESLKRPEALLVGTTADLYQNSVEERTATTAGQASSSSYFRSAQWLVLAS